MTNKGVSGFPSTAFAVPDGSVTTTSLSAGLAGWLTANQLTTGEETIPRFFLGNGGGTSSQNLRLTYFTARKTEMVTQVRLMTAVTAAGATPTLCRVGLYAVDSYGNGVLAASIANDTTLFATQLTAYTRSFTSPYQKVAGQRYAAAWLVVTGAATPTIAGIVNDVSPGGRAEFALAPRMVGVLAGQSDLPASFTDASLTAAQIMTYMAFLP